jgi:hypothetical protein
MLKTHGSAQVRAAAAQVQRLKWTLVRSRFLADYTSNQFNLEIDIEALITGIRYIIALDAELVRVLVLIFDML